MRSLITALESDGRPGHAETLSIEECARALGNVLERTGHSFAEVGILGIHLYLTRDQLAHLLKVTLAEGVLQPCDPLSNAPNSG